MIEAVLPLPTTEQTKFEPLFKKDTTEREWAVDISGQRKDFFRISQESLQQAALIKNVHGPVYKRFHQYLLTTHDLLHTMTSSPHEPVGLVYNSGLSHSQIGTSEETSEVTFVIELVISRWVYASTVYNNVFQTYNQIDSLPNFTELKEAVNYIANGIQDALIRLHKLKHIENDVWVVSFYRRKGSRRSSLTSSSSPKKGSWHSFFFSRSPSATLSSSRSSSWRPK